MFKCLELLLEDEQVCGASLHKAEGHGEIKIHLHINTDTGMHTHSLIYQQPHQILIRQWLTAFIPLKISV